MGRLTPRPPYRTAPEPPPAMPVNDPVGSLLRLIGWRLPQMALSLALLSLLAWLAIGLMPGDPVARARVRLFLLNFEKELFSHVSTLENRATKSNERALEKARANIRDRLTQMAPVFLKKF